MRVIYNHGDYNVFLTKKDLREITQRISGLQNSRYPWLEKLVLDGTGKQQTGEWLALTCSNDSLVAMCPNGISFKRIKKCNVEKPSKEINIFVFTPRLMKQEELSFYRQENKPDFHTIYTAPGNQLMTRYDGENKLYISIDPFDLTEADFN